MRVLAAGACAAAGGTRPRTKPVAAAPSKKLLRAGCAGAGSGSQHRPARTSLRRSELADIASLVFRPDLNGCPDLLPGSASAHTRIVASERRGATDPPHHCPLAVSQPLRCRISLTPGAWALCGGKAAVIWPRVG